MATDALKGLGKVGVSAGKALVSVDSPKASKALAALSFAGGMTGMGGSVGQRVGSMLAGTIGGAARGYALAGPVGAGIGAGAGAISDVFNLGGNANPQAAATHDQSWELFKTRAGSQLGADHLMNLVSAHLQNATPPAPTGETGFRGFMGRATGYNAERKWYLAFNPIAHGMDAYKAAFGEEAKAPAKPSMMAPAILPGVGSAMGQAMTYEDYAKASGMSSLNTSQLEFDKMATQLENMVGLLTSVRDNSEALKRLTPGYR